MQLKIVETMSHPDEVSGTSVLSDGTKVYWTEGRSSRMAVVSPNGHKEWVGVWREEHPIMKPFLGEDYGTVRKMTEPEAEEWEKARER